MRRDVDREAAGVVLVERTVVDAVAKPHGTTSRSRRQALVAAPLARGDSLSRIAREEGLPTS